MAGALDVARYLLHLAWQEPEPGVTPLQLQKLLYYVQGWSLAVRGRPMFAEPLQAWPHGPAVPTIYGEFKAHGRRPIPNKEASSDVRLSEQERALVASVWHGYGKYSASQLWRMTHDERPWKQARGDLPPDAESQNEMTHESMRTFFLEEYARGHTPGLGLGEIRQAEQEIAEGRGVPLKDALAKLRECRMR